MTPYPDRNDLLARTDHSRGCPMTQVGAFFRVHDMTAIPRGPKVRGLR
jgi:hypothetical protein